MFDISFVNGHAQALFSDPHSALISDREAKRLYAEESPIGKKYSVNENRVNQVNPFMSQVSYILPEYTINGVVRTWSGHSYFSFDYIVPVNRSGRDSHRISFRTFIQLQKGTDPAAFEKKMASVCKDLDEFKYQSVWLTLQPLHSLHLSKLTYARSGDLTFNQILLFPTAGFVTILCLLFIFCTVVFVKQIHHMNQTDPGYDRTRLCFVEAYDPQFLSSQ